MTVRETSPVKTRLTNSIMAFTSLAAWGVSRPASQFGHSGHPRPEPLSRTAPPVTMMTATRTMAANAMRR